MVDYNINNVTQVNREYIFLKLDDGKQLRIKSQLDILKELYPKVVKERNFYEKAAKELRVFADKKREMLPHYFTDSAIKSIRP